MGKDKAARMVGGARGQLMVEYAIVFTVVVAVIVWSSLMLFRPAVNRFFIASSNVIDQATTKVINTFSSP